MMHGNHVHFRKPRFYAGKHRLCPAHHRPSPGGSTMRPVEVLVPRVEPDMEKRTTQGHGMRMAPARIATQGRHPSSAREEGFFAKPLVAAKPAGKDPGGFEPDGKALARAFNHADPAGREKPVRRILRQPCRRVPLLRIYPARGAAHRIHGLFRGAPRCMPCIPFRRMASLPPGWFHCMDPADRAQQSPFACIQHRLFDPARGPSSSSGIPSSGHVFEASVLGPGNALSIIASTGWRPLWTPGRLREPAARPATGSSLKEPRVEENWTGPVDPIGPGSTSIAARSSRSSGKGSVMNNPGAERLCCIVGERNPLRASSSSSTGKSESGKAQMSHEFRQPSGPLRHPLFDLPEIRPVEDSIPMLRLSMSLRPCEARRAVKGCCGKQHRPPPSMRHRPALHLPRGNQAGHSRDQEPPL